MAFVESILSAESQKKKTKKPVSVKSKLASLQSSGSGKSRSFEKVGLHKPKSKLTKQGRPGLHPKTDAELSHSHVSSVDSLKTETHPTVVKSGNTKLKKVVSTSAKGDDSKKLKKKTAKMSKGKLKLQQGRPGLHPKTNTELSHSHVSSVDSLKTETHPKVVKSDNTKLKKVVSPSSKGDDSKKIKKKTAKMSKGKLKLHKKSGKANNLALETKIRELCVEYLKKWKHDRSNWKFEKARQIRLLSMVFDKEKVPSDSFEIYVEYMAKSSDSSKAVLVRKATEVVGEVEKWDGLSKEEQSTTPQPEVYKCYKRARTLLQHFQ